VKKFLKVAQQFLMALGLALMAGVTVLLLALVILTAVVQGWQ
jgi:hypothetical protein